MSETPKKSTTLVAPDGQRFDIPTPEGVATLKQKGWRNLTADEVKDAELQKQYGEGALPAIGAAASGAASTLTFGGSDLALAETPLAEANREISARNPTAHTVGSVAALGVPLLGEFGGASAAAQGARAAGSAVAAASKAAQGVGSAIRTGAEAVGLAKTGKVLGGAAQAAAEGLAFQAGQNVGEAARRNVDLDAETVLAHAGEAGVLGAGIGAVIPAAGIAARFAADKSIAALEKSAQAVRGLGFGGARVGVDVLEAGAGAVARRADDIGEAVASGARKGAGMLDRGAEAIVQRADDIGGAVEGAAGRIVREADERLLPKIREGLSEQTGRPDVIKEVFANTPEARALRQGRASETITRTREVESEKLGKALNEVWDQSLGHRPMFDDLAIAVKRDLQNDALASGGLTGAQHRKIVDNLLAQATKTQEQLARFNPESRKIFDDALDGFAKRALTEPSAESLYRGIDELRGAMWNLSKLDAKAGLGSTGAGMAAQFSRDMAGYAQKLLEDTAVWGEAGVLQQKVNAAYSRYRAAFDMFEKQFAAKGVKNAPVRVLDGQKIAKWSRDITGQPGQVRNAVVDDLVEAQQELLSLTDALSKRAQKQARDTLASGKATPAARARAEALEVHPDGVADVLNRSRGAITGVAEAKSAAAKAIDRAEVLQETQNALLSRQGAGVNPLPVELARGLGAGTLVGGAIGGVPGAIVGGGITSILQKYGALTSNPKTAIEFLNRIDKLRGADRERIAGWIKTTIGETGDSGARGALKRATELDGRAIGGRVRRGAEAVESMAPSARALLDKGSDATAAKILQARGAAERGVEAVASKLDTMTPSLMRRLLPAASYADVKNSSPQEWWQRTQRTIARAQADPQRLLEQTAREVDGIAEDLPGVADAIAKQKLRVLGYLADRMPRNPRPYMLGAPQWTPDPGALKAYRDIVMVATQPDALLPLVTTGLASRAQVDAVKTLWPQTFEDVKSQITNAVLEAAKEGKPVSYSARLRLGQLLGVPFDASQEPGFVTWLNKASGSQPPAEQQQDSSAQTLRAPLNLKTDTGLPTSARSAM